MKKTLITGAIMALVSTGAMAAKPIRPQPEDLTPRVEALESEVGSLNSAIESLDATNQGQDARIQEVEDALGNTKPGGGSSLVVVDATDKVIGVPWNTANNTYFTGSSLRMAVKVAELDEAYLLAVSNGNSTIDYSYMSRVFFTDYNCGIDGGEAFMDVRDGGDGPMPRAGVDSTGQLYVPDPSYTENSYVNTMRSHWVPGESYVLSGTCEVIDGSVWVRPAMQVSIDINFPVRMKFR